MRIVDKNTDHELYEQTRNLSYRYMIRILDRKKLTPINLRALAVLSKIVFDVNHYELVILRNRLQSLSFLGARKARLSAQQSKENSTDSCVE